VARDSYRSEIEAAHARIRQLETELARHQGAPSERLVSLRQQRAEVAQLARPRLTRLERAINDSVFLAASATAVSLGLMASTFALLALCVAVAVRFYFSSVGERRATPHRRELQRLDAQITRLEREQPTGLT
jgi:uncharacterized membrane protein